MHENHNKAVAKRKHCRCHNIPFPHMPGTVVGCVDFDVPQEWSEEEFESRRLSVIETKRGAWQ